MAVPGPTLADMLATVDPLLACCVPGGDGSMEVIKVLRLINKDMARTAVKAAPGCSVQLGERACISPHHMIQLMTGASKLDSLTVTLLTTSGRPHGPTMSEQIATCSSQWRELLLGMEVAFSSTKNLTIRVTYNLLDRAFSHGHAITDTSIAPPRCPASHYKITQAVCALIAPTVPLLQKLNLEGSCEDAAFDAFGAFCPHLTHLQVDPTTLPIKAFVSAGGCLTSLGSLTLKTPSTPFSSQPLGGYVGSALSALRGSLSLTSIVLDCPSKLSINCSPDKWRAAPQNLREFICPCEIKTLWAATALLAGLHRLSTTVNGGFHHVYAILDAAPHMQQLTVTNTEQSLRLNEHMLPGLSQLKDRMLQGLQCVIPLILLSGSSSTVKAILDAMPTLPSVHTCTLEFDGVDAADPLTHLPQVFPNLTNLYLKDRSLSQSLASPFEHMECLSAYTSLKQLTLCVRHSLTTQDLAGLCLSMPTLRVLGYMKCDNADLQELRTALVNANRHGIHVEEYNSS